MRFQRRSEFFPGVPTEAEAGEEVGATVVVCMITIEDEILTLQELKVARAAPGSRALPCSGCDIDRLDGCDRMEGSREFNFVGTPVAGDVHHCPLSSRRQFAIFRGDAAGRITRDNSPRTSNGACSSRSPRYRCPSSPRSDMTRSWCSSDVLWHQITVTQRARYRGPRQRARGDGT